MPEQTKGGNHIAQCAHAILLGLTSAADARK